MLQSAALAEAMSAPRPVIVAALLHDVGHFLPVDRLASSEEERDLQHEALGAAWLSRGFDQEVTGPIALHVQAKRYLCAAEPGYLASLSRASRRSLELQGGVMDDDAAATFELNPTFRAAITLRRCDDGGKDAGLNVRSLEHYRDMMTASLRRPG